VDEDDVVPQTAIMSLKRPKHTSLFRRAGMRSVKTNPLLALTISFSRGEYYDPRQSKILGTENSLSTRTNGVQCVFARSHALKEVTWGPI